MLKFLTLGTADETLLNSIQTYDAWKRMGKKVRKWEKACLYIPMYRPYIPKGVNEDEEGEKDVRFKIQLAAVFHEGQLEWNEGKSLDQCIIDRVNAFLKEKGIIGVNKEDFIPNIRAFEKRCKGVVNGEVEKELEEEKEKESMEEITPEDVEAMEAINKEIANEIVKEERKDGWTMKAADTMQTICEFHKVELPR